MSLLGSVLSNRAKQFARKVDTADRNGARASKRKAPNARVNNTAPTIVISALTGNEETVRIPLHKAGSVPTYSGKSHGTIATPRSYTIWLKAGQPAHPIYNREAWRAERYVNNVALPTGGKPVERMVERHPQGCACNVCREYARSMAERKPMSDPRIDPHTVKGVWILKSVHTPRPTQRTIKPIPVLPKGTAWTPEQLTALLNAKNGTGNQKPLGPLAQSLSIE